MHSCKQIVCFHDFDEVQSCLIGAPAGAIRCAGARERGRGSSVNLEVRHLQMVTAIAEEGSVTRAGNRLHLTQSALSHQLRDIEDRLGARIFQRLARRMVLTPAGERLLVSARAVLDQLQRAEEEIRRIGSDQAGLLRLCTECYTCYHWLPSLLKRFRQKFPRVEVRIVVEATRRPIQALLEGRLDLAVVSHEVRNRRILLKPLFQDEFVVVMSPEHRLAGRPYVRPEEFSEETLITYTGLEESTGYQKVLAPAGITPRQTLQVQYTEAMTEFIKAGLGVGVMAQWTVAPQIASGEVCASPFTQKGLHRQWNAALLRSGSAPDYLLEFVGLLAANPTACLYRPPERSGRRARRSDAVA